MLLPKQIWKDIKGYKGKYQVSNTGKVRSMNYRNTGKGKLMKLGIRNAGYLQLGLYKDGKYKYYLVHRLVAEAFIPNPNNLPQVNHIDENKTNNCVWNLEWCNAKYNSNYGTRLERCSKAHTGKQLSEEHKAKISETLKGNKLSEQTKGKISEATKGENNPMYGKHHSEEAKKKISENHTGKKPILMLDKNNNILACFDSIADANVYMGKSRCNTAICGYLRGRNKTAHKYKWAYINIITL